MGPIRIAAMLLAIALTAGCLTETASDDETPPGGGQNDTPSSGPSTGDQRESRPQTPAPQPNLTLSWEGCAGLFAMIEVPRQDVQEHLPTSLNASAYTAFTANIGYYAFTCERVVTAPSIYENVALLATWAVVEPKDESWGGEGAQRYFFEFIVDGANLVTPRTSPGAFEWSNTTISEAWSVRSGTSEFSFEAPVTHMQWQHGEALATYWFQHGEGQLLRVDSTETFAYDQAELAPGLLRISGDGKSHQVFGDQAAMAQGGYAKSMRWIVDPLNVYLSET